MLTVIDTYVAILVALGGTIFRLVAAKPDPEAFPMLAMLVALALSTYTQCLFALDGRGGLTRYALLPMPWWRVVLAKDACWLAVLLVLVTPLDIAPGMAFGFTVLAVGHYPAMRHRLPLHRWRFAGGRVFFGVSQMVLGATIGFGAIHHAAAYLMLAAALYSLSLFACRNMRKL
jgi:hypothetical protein